MVSPNPLPVDTTAFWRRRIFESIATGKMLHQIILDDNYLLWQRIQAESSVILKKYIKEGARVLDAGCGYGALVDAFDEARLVVNYVGLDISPDLIELARYRYPRTNCTFLVGDIHDLPFESEYFDWVVTRSVRGMIRENIGEDSWNKMEAEINRVGKRILRIEYPNGEGGQDLMTQKIDYFVTKPGMKRV